MADAVYLLGLKSAQKHELLETSRDHSGNVTVTTQIMVPMNEQRTAMTIVNDSDAKIYLFHGEVAALAMGIPLNAAGGSYQIDKTNLYKGPISAIHGGTGNKVLCITELESEYGW